MNIFKNLITHLSKFFSIFLLVALLNLTFLHQVSADQINQSVIFDPSLTSTLKTPIDLKTLQLEYWQQSPVTSPSQPQLLGASQRLRDIARYLGAKWSVSLPLNETFLITDVKNKDQKWIPLSAGISLKLITEELSTLDNKDQQPYLDFLVQDQISGNYYSLTQIPLDRYCYELINALTS